MPPLGQTVAARLRGVAWRLLQPTPQSIAMSVVRGGGLGVDVAGVAAGATRTWRDSIAAAEDGVLVVLAHVNVEHGTLGNLLGAEPDTNVELVVSVDGAADRTLGDQPPPRRLGGGELHDLDPCREGAASSRRQGASVRGGRDGRRPHGGLAVRAGDDGEHQRGRLGRPTVSFASEPIRPTLGRVERGGGAAGAVERERRQLIPVRLARALGAPAGGEELRPRAAFLAAQLAEAIAPPADVLRDLAHRLMMRAGTRERYWRFGLFALDQRAGRLR